MSAAACLKVILNGETDSSLATFDEFVKMAIVEDEDFLEVSRAEEKLVKTVKRVNERIAKRQD